MNKIILIAILPMAFGALLYLFQVYGYQVVLKRPGMAVAFFGYAVANGGLIWDAFQMGIFK